MGHSIEEKFSGKIDFYQRLAEVQHESADRLAKSLEPWRLILPTGPVLELGAGTGFLTNHLVRLLKDRELMITDLSADMLNYCRENLMKTETEDLRIQFKRLDAENFQPPVNHYAMVCGNFVVQWFRDPALTLSRFADALKPGGLLLAAFPGHESFPEWREQCLKLGLPFTGNDLPNTEELVIKLSMCDGQVDFYEDSRTVEYPNAISFFRNLKLTGADTKLHSRQLKADKFRLLLDHWDRSENGPVKVTWHLVFFVFKRDQ